VARFLLVHGAWHGGWCFEQIAGELERRGHVVEAPDLPCDRVGQTVCDYAALIGPRPDAVVVGHSLGGLTIPFVEARVRVYLAALLPVENVYDDALLDDFDGFLRDELDRSYWPDRETAFAKLYPDCPREVSDAAFERLRPQAPIDPVPAPVSAGDLFVVTARDRAVDPTWQRRAAAEHRLRTFELDAGHSPFLTQPAELAALLDSLA
jgi:pimeloyl-ACP methyl ester carboxylesterase